LRSIQFELLANQVAQTVEKLALERVLGGGMCLLRIAAE
jgi:hypothetical protein